MFGEYEDLLERYTQAKSCGFQVITLQVSFSHFLLLFIKDIANKSLNNRYTTIVISFLIVLFFHDLYQDKCTYINFNNFL